MGTRTTRLDVQATARFTPGQPDLAKHVHAAAIRYGRQHARAPAVRFSGEDVRIQTVYLGSRTSERYGRVYDKMAESKDEHFRDCWRWEVEVKGDPADHLTRRLVATEHANDLALAHLRTYFDGAGVDPPMQLPQLDGPWRIAYRHTDDDRRLRWLREQVAPVLIGLVDRGRRDDALDAMGVHPIRGDDPKAETEGN